jgi:hypothetical protein
MSYHRNTLPPREKSALPPTTILTEEQALAYRLQNNSHDVTAPNTSVAALRQQYMGSSTAADGVVPFAGPQVTPTSTAADAVEHAESHSVLGTGVSPEGVSTHDHIDATCVEQIHTEFLSYQQLGALVPIVEEVNEIASISSKLRVQVCQVVVNIFRTLRRLFAHAHTHTHTHNVTNSTPTIRAAPRSMLREHCARGLLLSWRTWPLGMGLGCPDGGDADWWPGAWPMRLRSQPARGRLRGNTPCDRP